MQLESHRHYWRMPAWFMTWGSECFHIPCYCFEVVGFFKYPVRSMHARTTKSVKHSLWLTPFISSTNPDVSTHGCCDSKVQGSNLKITQKKGRHLEWQRSKAVVRSHWTNWFSLGDIQGAPSPTRRLRFTAFCFVDLCVCVCDHTHACESTLTLAFVLFRSWLAS